MTAFGPVVEWQVLAKKLLKPHVSFQAAAAGHPMAVIGVGRRMEASA